MTRVFEETLFRGTILDFIKRSFRLPFIIILYEQRLMRVISASRNVTKDQSTIETVVEINKDNRTKGVEDSIRLTFSFQRSQVHRIKNQSNVVLSKNGGIMESSDEKNKDKDSRKKRRRPNEDGELEGELGTTLTYFIDVSKDHMQKERLIEIVVEAVGLSPSIESAIPFEVDDDESLLVEEFDENGEVVAKKDSHGANNQENENNNDENNVYAKNDEDVDEYESRDRFSAYVDPQTLQHFLESTGLDLDVQNSLFLLMSFPYYEHEWDIFGFLLECVFGDDVESMETVEDEEVED